jgi:hypothetical protein
MSIGTILIILLILVLIGALPTWPYSSGWGYYPSGGLGLILLIVIILLLTGRLWRAAIGLATLSGAGTWLREAAAPNEQPAHRPARRPGGVRASGRGPGPPSDEQPSTGAALVSVPEAEAREFQRIIRASVREFLDTWRLQTQAGPVTPDAVDLIVTQAAMPILELLEDRPPERALALVPSLLRLVLAAVLEVMAEREPWPPRRPEDEGGRFWPTFN